MSLFSQILYKTIYAGDYFILDETTPSRRLHKFKARLVQREVIILSYPILRLQCKLPLKGKLEW